MAGVMVISLLDRIFIIHPFLYEAERLHLIGRRHEPRRALQPGGQCFCLKAPDIKNQGEWESLPHAATRGMADQSDSSIRT